MSSNANEVNTEDSEACLKACREFMELTGSQMTTAVINLQDHNWDVQAAYERYKKETEQSASGYLRVVSWNIDGLSHERFDSRMRSIAQVILREQADLILLQEVKVSSMHILSEILKQMYDWCFDFEISRPANNQQYYYGCAIMWKKSKMQRTSEQVFYQSFSTSAMDRGYLGVELKLGSILLTALTTHLESTKKCTETRIKQFNELLAKIATIRSKDNRMHVICGGDMNIRDSEMKSVQMPNDVFDLWECNGSREASRFTWNPRINHNNACLSNARYIHPQRFDRLYWFPMIDIVGNVDICPYQFSLAGIEKAHGCQSFCSDHWAIRADFEILSSASNCAQ